MESRIYLVVCMLLPLTQLTFSEDYTLWCNLQQEHSVHAVNGQNISLSFNLADPFGSTQSLVWGKGDQNVCEKLNNSSLNCSTDESSNPGRYTLTQLNGTSFDMFIAFTEQNDSGQHTVKIQQGTQSLCTIVMLNLTIEGTPICSALVSQQSGKMKMSCQWSQVSEGDRAQLLAGDQVVYEYETPEMNFRGEHNLTNKLSAYVALQDIFMENMLPRKCVVTNNRMKTRGGCTFPTKPVNHIGKESNQTAVFECCKIREQTTILWWYTNGDFLLPFTNTENGQVVDDNQIALLCRERNGHFKIVHDILRMQFHVSHKCNISVSSKGLKSSFITIHCTNTSENMEDMGTSKLHPMNYNSMVLYSLALALTFSLCGCFTKCCHRPTFFRKRRYRLKKELDQGTSNVRNNEDADSVDMTVLSTQTPQPHRLSEVTHSALSQCLSDDNNRCANQEELLSDFDRPNGPPVLPSRRHLVRRDNKCCETSTVKQLTGDNVCDMNIVRKNNTGAGASTASNHDSTYCSVDDVQGTLTGIRGSDSKSFLSFLPTSMTPGDYHGNCDLFNQKESSSPSADPDKKNLVIHSHSNPDSFYAQPHMSRRAKRMTSVESDYDDPRPPGEEYFQNIHPKRNCLESSVLNNDPTYGNYNSDPPTGSASEI